MTAVEALRKARATAFCTGRKVQADADCAFYSDPDTSNAAYDTARKERAA